MRRLIPAITLALLAACSDGGGKDPLGEEPPGSGEAAALQVVSSLRQTDTIQAVTNVTVKVTTATGAPTKNSSVVFSVLPDNGVPDTASIRVAFGEGAYSGIVSANTDDNGMLTVRVRQGNRVGTARLRIVSVPNQVASFLDYSTTVGASDRVVISPIDTVIVPGQTLQISGKSVDRTGNVRTDPVVFTAASSLATVAADGRITGVSTGVQVVEATVTSNGKVSRGSMTLFIPPSAQLAWGIDASRTLPDRVSVGSFSFLSPALVGGQGSQQPAWQPGTDRIVYVESNSQHTALMLHGPIGNDVELSTGSAIIATWPEFSPDGQWVYFGAQANGVSRIFRIRMDGSTPELITPNDTAAMPTLSPDGNSVAFASNRALKVIDLRSGEVRVLAVSVGGNSSNGVSSDPVSTPRWSPNGKYIAYLTGGFGGTLNLFNLENSTRTPVLAPGLLPGTTVDRVWYPGFSWSADSQWLVGFNTISRGILVYMPTMQTRSTRSIGQGPAWKR